MKNVLVALVAMLALSTAAMANHKKEHKADHSDAATSEAAAPKKMKKKAKGHAASEEHSNMEHGAEGSEHK